MSDYTLTQAEYRRLKSNLTRAINSKDPVKVIDTVAIALGIFEEKGYPDSHSRWTRAREDAWVELRRRPIAR